LIPNNATANFQLAAALSSLDQSTFAAEFAKKAVELQPNDPSMAALYVTVLYKIGQLDVLPYFNHFPFFKRASLLNLSCLTVFPRTNGLFLVVLCLFPSSFGKHD
jgi:hypothetical protein